MNTKSSVWHTDNDRERERESFDFYFLLLLRGRFFLEWNNVLNLGSYGQWFWGKETKKSEVSSKHERQISGGSSSVGVISVQDTSFFASHAPNIKFNFF